MCSRAIPHLISQILISVLAPPPICREPERRKRNGVGAINYRKDELINPLSPDQGLCNNIRAKETRPAPMAATHGRHRRRPRCRPRRRRRRRRRRDRCIARGHTRVRECGRARPTINHGGLRYRLVGSRQTTAIWANAPPACHRRARGN